VRRRHDVVELEQRARVRLLGEDVESRARDLARPERLAERRFVDELTACRVDDAHAVARACERARVDRPARLRIQRQVEREELGHAEDLVLRLQPLHAELAEALRAHERVVGHDAHPEPGRAARDLLPDPAEAEHAERLPGELDPDRFCVVVSFTDDQGLTWTSADPVCDADADRPRVITSVPVTSSPTGYPSLVHLCYFHSSADGQSCLRSLDGGRTFRPTGEIAPDGCDSGVSGALFGHLATDHTGALYLARMSCRRPVVAISRDEGATWDEHAIGPPGWNGYGETAVAVDEDGVVYGLWISNDRLPLPSVPARK